MGQIMSKAFKNFGGVIEHDDLCSVIVNQISKLKKKRFAQAIQTIWHS